MSKDFVMQKLMQSAAKLLSKPSTDEVQSTEQVVIGLQSAGYDRRWPGRSLDTSPAAPAPNSRDDSDLQHSISRKHSGDGSSVACLSSSSSQGLSPLTPPGTPSKLLQTSSIDSSSNGYDSSRRNSTGCSSSQETATADDDLSVLSQTLSADLRIADATDASSGLAFETRYQAFRGKRILIISGGTRGDVQPATALGVTLAGLGAHVCIAADRSFRDFVQQHGLQYQALGGDARQMMALTVSWGGMLPTDMMGMFWLRGQIKEVMESVWAAAQAFEPDVILANQLAYGQVHVAEKLGVPLHIILTIPWVPTRSIAHPWARAYGANTTEYMMAAARALLNPAFAAVKWVNPKLGSRVQGRVLTWVAGFSNYISTPLLDHMAWSGIADLMGHFRYKLGLTQFSRNNLGSALYRYPTSCLFSSHLVPRPSDWQPHVSITGFLCLDDAVRRFGHKQSTTSSCTTAAVVHEDSDPTDARSGIIYNVASLHDVGTRRLDPQSAAAAGALWQPPQELLDFLAAGPAPMYIGFGSMVVQEPAELMQTVLTATQGLPETQRFVICSGWSGMTPDSDEEGTTVGATAQQLMGSKQARGAADSSRILFIKEAPHEWLFPRCSALLHHGGVGTTAVGLKHGKPTLVISAFGDLFFWGEVCHKLGVGPAAIPLEQLDSVTLTSRMKDLLTDIGYRKAAATVAQQLLAEDGMIGAIESLMETVDSLQV